DRAGEPGLARGAQAGPQPGARPEHVRRARHVRPGRRGARPGGAEARRGAGLNDIARAVSAYLDHLTVERGLAANTLASYRRDLRRYDGFLAASGIDDLGRITE